MKPLTAFEIPAVLERASLFGGKVSQPFDNKTVSSPIRKIEADKNGLLVFTFHGESEIASGKPLCVRLNYRDIYFQFDSTEFSVNGTQVVSPFPREVRALEPRDYERYVLPLNSQIQASVYRTEKRGGNLETHASVLDVSRTGLGLLLRNTEEQMLLANDHLWIRHINGMTLEKPLFGRVVYTHNRVYKDGPMDIKAGISLDTAIPEEVIEGLQQISTLVLK